MGPQNLWNPFRDWNKNDNLLIQETLGVSQPQNLWNPFRDWNKNDGSELAHREFYRRHKTSETLLGIETEKLMQGDED